MAVNKETGFSGVENHGDQVRIVFMYEGNDAGKPALHACGTCINVMLTNAAIRL